MFRFKRAEFIDWAIPLVIAAFPLLWLAPIHRQFNHTYSDWKNNLWMIGYFGEYFRRHLSFPMTFNTDPWVGMPNPLFYGPLFFPLAGLVSALIGPALALRIILFGLLWLQTTQISRMIKAIYPDSYAAWAIAAVVAFAIYPLTNIYSRSAIPEFAAVSLLTSACSLWIRASIVGPQPKNWNDASWACLLLALSAGTHSLTALIGGILFGILVLSGIIRAADSGRRAAFMARYTILYLAVLSPWIYVVMKFSSRLNVARASFQGMIDFGDSIDLWWVRLLPIPFDIRPLWVEILSKVPTPYLDAQINFGLLVIAAFLAIQLRHRWRVCRQENGFTLTAAVMCFTAILGMYYLSVSPQIWQFLPHSLCIIQFAYRLISYIDLLLLILIILLLSLLKRFRLEFENKFKLCLMAAVILMAQAVLVKFNHAAFTQEKRILTGTGPFDDRSILVHLPPTFYSPLDYVIQDGYAGNAPALPRLNFLAAAGPRFGQVPTVSLNGARSFETNIQAFPWNKLVINGSLLPQTETYLSTGNTLAFGDFGRGPANQVAYAFVPDRAYVICRYVSAAALISWIGFLIGTACWRRRSRLLR